MPIDFNCPTCKKLLRVPDGAAGRQAKCPQCGNVVLVPAASAFEASAPPVPPTPPLPPAEQLMSDDEEFRIAPPTATPSYKPQVDNPFASPVSVGSNAPELDDSGERNGPPWESQGPSVGSFIETLKLVFSNPIVMFSTMRCVGGLGLPLGFLIAGGWIGGLFSTGYSIIKNLAFPVPAAMQGGHVAFDLNHVSTVTLIVTLVFYPVLLAIGAFIMAGLQHLFLMMLDGARQPFETTFRVYCYAAGATSLLNVVPFLGGILGLIGVIVYSIIGLQKAQGISGGKAAGAVLIPYAICFGCCVGGVFMLGMMMAVGAR